MKRFLVALLVSFILVPNLKGQDSAYRYTSISKRYVISYFTDGWKVFTSPVKWKGKQWLTLGACAASGALLYTQDEAIRSQFMRFHSNGMNVASHDVFEPWGSGLYSVPLMGGIYLTGYFSGNKRLAATALTAGKAAAIGYVLVNMGKQLSHRHRPYQDDPADHTSWDGPLSDPGYTSFPSGHTMLVFSIASVLASEYKDKPWVPVVAYSIATGTAMSRIYDSKHWATDVFAGAVLGYCTGRLIWKLNKVVQVSPSLSRQYGSIRMIFPL